MYEDETTAEDLKVSEYSVYVVLFLLACGVVVFFGGLAWFFKS